MNRKSLEEQFLTQGSAPWKTFVMDVHDRGEPREFLSDVFGSASIQDTEDEYLHSVNTTEVRFVVDNLEDRF